MLLRVIEIGAMIAIVVWGIIRLIEMFSGWKIRRAKATALETLAKQAEEVAKKKKDILKETEETKKTIDDINNTLN